MKLPRTAASMLAEDEYPKLVRDKIPDIIANNDGKKAATRTLNDDDEFLTFLLRKAIEEATELSQTTTDAHLIEEIADIYEVIDAILKLKGISHANVLQLLDEKRARRGGFEKRLLLLHND